MPPAGLYHRVLREVECPLLSAALAATRGNQIKAAELLGLNRNTLAQEGAGARHPADALAAVASAAATWRRSD